MMDRLITALLLLWSASVACAAVSKEVAPIPTFFDAVVSASITGYTVTCAGGNPLIMATVASTEETVDTTGVAYNTLALTKHDEIVINGVNGSLEVWYRASTTGSSQTLTASFAGGSSYGFLSVQAFCGVNQGSPLGAPVSTEGALTELTLAVTVPAGGMAMGAMAVYEGSFIEALTAQSGATIEPLSQVDDECCNQSALTTRTITGDCGVTWDTSVDLAGAICVPINQAVAAVGNFFERRRQ